MEYTKNIRATHQEIEKLFNNEENNYTVKYYEKINDGIYKTIIRVPENIELPKSKTLSIRTIKKILETEGNVNPWYIDEEFQKIKNMIDCFNEKKYPRYEDMDIKLMLSNVTGIKDFCDVDVIYSLLKEKGAIEELKNNIKFIIEEYIATKGETLMTFKTAKLKH